MSSKKTQKIEVGDTLVSTWGYGQTNVDFYSVVEKTKTGVKIIPVEGITKKWNSKTHQGTMIPGEPQHHIKPRARKIKQSQYSEEYISICSYAGAWKWDGKPVDFSMCY